MHSLIDILSTSVCLYFMAEHPRTLPQPRPLTAAGNVSIGQRGVGFNSDRVDVLDGASWSFTTWGEHNLPEPRHHMGSAVMEIYTGSVRKYLITFSSLTIIPMSVCITYLHQLQTTDTIICHDTV